ncbi:cutinase transcription factor 1 beta [Fusarium subglutinans]|uniref:Cutinase transcription factor 1 beta n=1 Tax=Gibberella subglutinans TaxID=42677 RepID=A0A8H5L977_GIBSU|nr:cutinase transcription factor 1 beta [Fusarium subglutinans]KAF5587637.1 cutinase transcription factor 1 beta [Fusarium subglutinans]
MPLPSRASSTPKISKACVPCRTRKIKCNAAVVGLPCGSCPRQQQLPTNVSRQTTDSSHSDPVEESIHASHTGSSLRNDTPHSRDRRPPGQTQADLLYLNILQDTVNDTSAAQTDASDHQSNDEPDDSFNSQIHHWNPPPQLDDVDNEYLAKKKVFELPPPRDDIVKAYFDYVHPFAPILNRTDFIQSYRSGGCCLFLLHAVAAAASLYVTHDVLIGCGYPDRSTAQASFFSKAKLFHDFHCQGDPLSMLQGSMILGAIILDHPSDRDFQYWFHNSVRRASKMGVQNACLRDDGSQKLYRRIWWVLHNRDIFHFFINTQNMRLLANAPPIRPLTEADWETEEIEQWSGILSPISQAQKVSLIAQCELAQIFGNVMSVVTSSNPSAEEIHKRILPLDAWRTSLAERMQLMASFSDGEIYHLEALTTSHRFECIMCRLLRRGRWQMSDGGLREWAQQRFRSAIFELDTIVKRVMINSMIQKLPTTFITTITALLALHIESALDAAESSLIRSMARISVQHTMLALDQIRDTPAIKRALPAFEIVLSKNKLYPMSTSDTEQVNTMQTISQDQPLSDGHILQSPQTEMTLPQDDQSFLAMRSSLAQRARDTAYHASTRNPRKYGEGVQLIKSTEALRDDRQKSSNADSSIASPDPLPYLPKFVTGQESIEQSTWLTDLELMHQYSTSTYLTLPRADELRQIWQIELPRLSLSHFYLLHQVLSVSAFHLASLHPDRSDYAICASQHQNKAIAGLRSAVACITEESCVEIFLSSSLLGIGAFAGLGAHNAGQQPRIDDLLDVFVLIRGMNDILNRYEPLLKESRIAYLFVLGNQAGSTPLLDATLAQLRQIVIPDGFEDEALSICQESIASAITWIERHTGTTAAPDERIAMTWCLSVSPEFLDLIRQRHPVALCVLAHYCVVLDRVGRSQWFMRNWGKPVLQDIRNEMEPQWSSMLQWCLAAVECERNVQAH